MGRQAPPAVNWSCRIYARLLALLPQSFRRDYDRPILQAFHDLSYDAWQAHGLLGLFALWIQALPDLVEGAAGEWQHAFTFGGYMERVSVRTSLLMILMILAILLVVLVFPLLPISVRTVVEVLILLGFMAIAISAWHNRRSQPATTEDAGHDLTAPIPHSGGSAWIRALLIGLELVFLILFVYECRVVLPPLHPPIQSQFGLLIYATNFGDILIAVYLAVTVFGTRRMGTHALSWLVATITGLVGGVAVAVLALESKLDEPAQVLAMLIVAVLAGFIAGGLGGRTEAGAIGGFWYGLACALVWSTAGLVIDFALSPYLARTPWYGSHMSCLGLSGNAVVACAVGGDRAIWGRVLLELPILSGALGIVGGFLGSALRHSKPPLKADWGRALVAPVVFCAVMILLLILPQLVIRWMILPKIISP